MGDIEWKLVDRLQPVDLSNIQDKGMKGAAMLAVALGWNLLNRPGQPAQLISREGLRRNIPTDTGVRQSVFWSLVAGILSHSDGQLPTQELVDLIVNQTGMSRAHAHVLKSRTALLATGSEVHAKDEGDEEGLGDEGEPSEDVAEDVHEPEPEAASAIALEPEMSMRVEPTLNMAGDGEQYISPIMDTIIRALVPDGEDQITYRCKICQLEFPSKRGVGAHYQVHTKAGEAEPTAQQKRTIVNKIEDYQPTEVHIRQGSATAEVRRLQAIIKDVQKAVGQAAIKEAERQVEVAERKLAAMTKERDAAITRADRLASDLRSLRELIGGISDA